MQVTIRSHVQTRTLAAKQGKENERDTSTKCMLKMAGKNKVAMLLPPGSSMNG
jgi:hypothetical protein